MKKIILILISIMAFTSVSANNDINVMSSQVIVINKNTKASIEVICVGNAKVLITISHSFNYNGNTISSLMIDADSYDCKKEK